MKTNEVNTITRTDRIRGVLTGQACGDALGSPYEFRPPPEFGEARFGVGTFGHPAGSYTDDTEQATCVARARSNPQRVASNLLAWFRSGPRDVGASTAQVLGHAESAAMLPSVSRAFGEWQASKPVPKGWDPGMANGSLMRTGPVCLPHLGNRERVAELAREVSDLTHADPWAGDACVLQSLCIEAAIVKGDEFDLGEDMLDGLKYLPAERRTFWQKTIVVALTGPQPSTQNGSAVGAFKCALWSLAHTESLVDALQLCAHLGGDTDTVGAICGALAGAMYGASSVPDEWRSVLHGWLDMTADGLEQLALEAAE